MFSQLGFNVKLQLSGMNHITCRKLSNISANIAVAIFRVNKAVGNILEALYRAGSRWQVLTGTEGEWADIQLAMSMRLRKKGDKKFLLRGMW
jgi:hypothetical protein